MIELLLGAICGAAVYFAGYWHGRCVELDEHTREEQL